MELMHLSEGGFLGKGVPEERQGHIGCLKGVVVSPPSEIVKSLFRQAAKCGFCKICSGSRLRVQDSGRIMSIEVLMCHSNIRNLQCALLRQMASSNE